MVPPSSGWPTTLTRAPGSGAPARVRRAPRRTAARSGWMVPAATPVWMGLGPSWRNEVEPARVVATAAETGGDRQGRYAPRVQTARCAPCDKGWGPVLAGDDQPRPGSRPRPPGPAACCAGAPSCRARPGRGRSKGLTGAPGGPARVASARRHAPAPAMEAMTRRRWAPASFAVREPPKTRVPRCGPVRPLRVCPAWAPTERARGGRPRGRPVRRLGSSSSELDTPSQKDRARSGTTTPRPEL
jgi:hypothetical protein